MVDAIRRIACPRLEMQCVLVYDISNDGKRTKIADVCIDYGLDRIQFSAFAGDLAPTHQEELMLKIADVLGKLPGKVQLVPVCEKDWSARRVIEQKESENESRAEKDTS